MDFNDLSLRTLSCLSDLEIAQLLKNKDSRFKDFIDAHKKFRTLSSILKSREELFEKLIAEQLISTSDISYLLNAIDDSDEIFELTAENSLMHYLYEHNILNKKHIDRFNKIILDEKYWVDAFRGKDFFDFVAYNATHQCDVIDIDSGKAIKKEPIDCSLLKLNEVCRYAYSFEHLNFSEDEKLQLFVLIENNEVVQKKLKHIVTNELESTFASFDELIRHLKKKEKKNALSI